VESHQSERVVYCQVTGGSSGIGKAVAEAVVRYGANVTLMARNKVSVNQKEYTFGLPITCNHDSVAI